MDITKLPARFPIPFADSAVAPYIRSIPTPSQIPFQSGAASLTDGFPPSTFLPIGAGGTPPFGEDMNGIINQISAWCRWVAAGGPVPYDNTFAVAVGGYPQGSILPSTIPGSFWISTVDNNLTDPNGASPVGWSAYGPSTGDAKPTLKTAADYGWVVADDGTIGSVASNATTYANALASPLYSLIWAGVSNTYAPIFTSAGAPTTRGANAAADFAANKQLALTKVLGRALVAAGAGSGLTARALGQTWGQEAIAILQANLPALTLPVTLNNLNVATLSALTGALVGGGSTFNTTNGGGTSASVATGGSGTPLATVQPSSGWYVHIKL